jgi:hypothetical protein
MARMALRQAAHLLFAALASAYESDADIKARLFSNYGSTSTSPGLSQPALGANPSCGLPPPDEIRVQAYIEKLHTLDISGGTFGFDGYLRAWWTDPRLAFNGTANGGCVDKLSIGTKEQELIWTPEFYWEGAKQITMPHEQRGTGQLLEVYPDGKIWWSRQTSFKLSCPFASNLDALPFDTQTCTFMLGMYADTSFDSYLRWKEGRAAIANTDGTACLVCDCEPNQSPVKSSRTGLGPKISRPQTSALSARVVRDRLRAGGRAASV